MLTAAAGGEEPVHVLGADVSQLGVVTITYFGRPGSTVYFRERVGAVVKDLGSRPIGPDAFVALPEATVWRCDRPKRHFESTEMRADGTQASGSFAVRTDSCARRFKLTAPSRVGRGAVARVRVIDRWKIGNIRTRLCITPPGGPAACRSVPFRRAVDIRSQQFRATKTGRWRIELRVRGHRLRAAVAVGNGVVAQKPAPVVLATGDSSMQGIDSFLTDGLGERARVRSEVHPGTAISKGDEWIARAKRQARLLKPRTTVISLGGSEGYPMNTPSGTAVNCCSAAWLLEYRRRVVVMMKSYLRGGTGKVLWLAAPAPRSPLLAPVTAQVNQAILSAGTGRPGVKVLRLDTLFTPNGYSDVIRYRGDDVNVRAVDGLHLNIAGTAIAANAIEAALRKGW